MLGRYSWLWIICQVATPDRSAPQLSLLWKANACHHFSTTVTDKERTAERQRGALDVPCPARASYLRKRFRVSCTLRTRARSQSTVEAWSTCWRHDVWMTPPAVLILLLTINVQGRDYFFYCVSGFALPLNMLKIMRYGWGYQMRLACHLQWHSFVPVCGCLKYRSTS